MTEREAVVAVLEICGGIATLSEINQNIFQIKDCKWETKTPFASIRRIVRHSPEIYRVKPGLYALQSHRHYLESNGIVIETEKNKDSKEVIDFNHSYYLGILVNLGNMKKMTTFIPDQDKNRKFLNTTLGNIKTLPKIPDFSYDHIVARSSTIDVIWFNKRDMPHSFFEIEHSTDIQNSLLKFVDLQDFNTRMYIVADIRRKHEYDKKMTYQSFYDLTQPIYRVKFLSYDELIRQYELQIQQQELRILL
ncbi:MAG: winged helix-turn-helix domain-containing protein [Clostridium sp.]|nr:winged helix-turn-helix domain-containing protein [Bacteroides sp.]MCM1199061.1 winged helix-turn-helix domain-containing protein [Clostridium sp.]